MPGRSRRPRPRAVARGRQERRAVPRGSRARWQGSASASSPFGARTSARTTGTARKLETVDGRFVLSGAPAQSGRCQGADEGWARPRREPADYHAAVHPVGVPRAQPRPRLTVAQSALPAHPAPSEGRQFAATTVRVGSGPDPGTEHEHAGTSGPPPCAPPPTTQPSTWRAGTFPGVQPMASSHRATSASVDQVAGQLALRGPAHCEMLVALLRRRPERAACRAAGTTTRSSSWPSTGMMPGTRSMGR